MTKQQQQTYALIAMLVCGGGYFYWTKVFSPLMKTISTHKADLEKKKKDLQEAIQKESQLKKLKEDAGKFEERLFITYSRLPVKEEMHLLFNSLNRAEKVSKMTVTPIIPSAEGDRGNFIEVPFKINAEGDYQKLASFINFLHRQDRLFAIRDIQFTAVGNPPSPGRSFKLEATVSAFRSKGETPVWTQKMPALPEFKPTYAFAGAFKDPFIPISPQELAEMQTSVSLDRLECTGVLRFGRSLSAQFQDTISRANYTLKKNRLYQTTSQGDQFIPSIRGEIKAKSVILKKSGKSQDDHYEKQYPIPNL